MKFRVIAAHSVTMNSVTLRRMYLTVRSAFTLPRFKALTRWVYDREQRVVL